MDLTESPIFRNFPWHTDIPYGDYEAAIALFDATEDEGNDDDGMSLEGAATVSFCRYHIIAYYIAFTSVFSKI